MFASSEPSSPAAPPPLAPFPDLADGDAITEIMRGNREMFAVIVRRYNQALYRVGMAYLRNHAQTEDAMQNTYLKAFTALGTFQRQSAFSTWLTRIMINECLMLLRREKSAHLAMEIRQGEIEIAPGPSASEQINRQEMKTTLERAIAVLPRNYRAVYMLREVQQLSVADTARCLGLSQATVKVQLHRARERLKTELLKTTAGIELFTYTAASCDPMTARVMAAVRILPIVSGR